MQTNPNFFAFKTLHKLKQYANIWSSKGETVQANGFRSKGTPPCSNQSCGKE